jgi:hypothetical protein
VSSLEHFHHPFRGVMLEPPTQTKGIVAMELHIGLEPTGHVYGQGFALEQTRIRQATFLPFEDVDQQFPPGEKVFRGDHSAEVPKNEPTSRLSKSSGQRKHQRDLFLVGLDIKRAAPSRRATWNSQSRRYVSVLIKTAQPTTKYFANATHKH